MYIIHISLIILFIIFLFFIKFYLTSIKGEYGEKRVSILLSKLNKEEYKILNDVYLKSGTGKTYQIDHVIISPFGIFVIETKNYSGWIFGNEKSENWTQVIYKRKTKFRNPIKQNWSHICVLKEVLREYNRINFFSIIVFVGNAVLKNIVSDTPVIYLEELLATIKKETISQCLTTDDVLKIIGILNSVNIQDKEIKREHIKNVKGTILEKQLKRENLICPKCNSQLVLRHGQYGRFYGCSKYPSCKFTMKY